MNTTIVNLGGEPRPIKFGFNALTEFGELTHRNIDQINNLQPNTLTMKDLMLLCWCALKQGSRKEQKEFPFTVEDIGDWLDDSPEALVDITSEFNRSRAVDPDHPSVKKKAGVNLKR